jgi:hypothetical protein
VNIEEAYVTFLSLVNRNATNNNVNVDKSRFIMFFRDVELRFYDWVLKNRHNDTIRQARHLLVPRKKLQSESEEDKYDLYSLPEDYFELSSLHVDASNGTCSGSLRTEEIKSENIEDVLTDEFTKPSFDFRETVYHLSEDDKVSIYKDDFEITNVDLTYYRLPRQVSIEGYTKVDGSASTQNIDPEWDEKTTYKILLYMSKEFAAKNADQAGYHLSKDSLFEGLQQ